MYLRRGEGSDKVWSSGPEETDRNRSRLKLIREDVKGSNVESGVHFPNPETPRIAVCSFRV